MADVRGPRKGEVERAEFEIGGEPEQTNTQTNASVRSLGRSNAGTPKLLRCLAVAMLGLNWPAMSRAACQGTRSGGPHSG